jgi:hypothetical protein
MWATRVLPLLLLGSLLPHCTDARAKKRNRKPRAGTPGRRVAESAVTASLAALGPDPEAACTLARVPNMTVSRFLAQHFQRQPFIMTAGTDNDAPRAKWTEEYLRKRYGSRSVSPWLGLLDH